MWRALDVFQYFLLKSSFFLQKCLIKGINSEEFLCQKILNSRAKNVITPLKTLLPLLVVGNFADIPGL